MFIHLRTVFSCFCPSRTQLSNCNRCQSQKYLLLALYRKRLPTPTSKGSVLCVTKYTKVNVLSHGHSVRPGLTISPGRKWPLRRSSCCLNSTPPAQTPTCALCLQRDYIWILGRFRASAAPHLGRYSFGVHGAFELGKSLLDNRTNRSVNVSNPSSQTASMQPILA